MPLHTLLVAHCKGDIWFEYCSASDSNEKDRQQQPTELCVIDCVLGLILAHELS